MLTLEAYDRRSHLQWSIISPGPVVGAWQPLPASVRCDAQDLLLLFTTARRNSSHAMVIVLPHKCTASMPESPWEGLQCVYVDIAASARRLTPPTFRLIQP